MRKKNKIPATTYIMWCILLIAIVKNIHVPEKYNLHIGTKYQVQINDLIYFISIDIIFLLWAHFAWLFTRTIIAGILVRLAIGKIIDEFVAPYGYSWGELAWDIGVAAWAIYRWVKISRKWEDNRV